MKVFSLMVLGFATAAIAAEVSLDPSMEMLPPGFKASNAASLIAAIEKRKDLSPKSEFETSAEFEARLEAAAQKPLQGGAAINEDLGFYLPEDSFSAKYHADEKTMYVSWSPGSSYVRIPSDFHNSGREAVLWTQSRKIGSFVGVNAFNSKTLVDRYSVSRVILFFETDRPFACMTAKIPMESEVAKVAKANLGVLVVAKPMSPFIAAEDSGRQATIDDPREVRIKTKALNVDVRWLWVVNRKTGQILSRTSFNDDYCILH